MTTAAAMAKPIRQPKTAEASEILIEMTKLDTMRGEARPARLARVNSP